MAFWRTPSRLSLLWERITNLLTASFISATLSTAALSERPSFIKTWTFWCSYGLCRQRCFISASGIWIEKQNFASSDLSWFLSCESRITALFPQAVDRLVLLTTRSIRRIASYNWLILYHQRLFTGTGIRPTTYMFRKSQLRLFGYLIRFFDLHLAYQVPYFQDPVGMWALIGQLHGL